jgi:hypothetical protein
MKKKRHKNFNSFPRRALPSLRSEIARQKAQITTERIKWSEE